MKKSRKFEEQDIGLMELYIEDLERQLDWHETARRSAITIEEAVLVCKGRSDRTRDKMAHERRQELIHGR